MKSSSFHRLSADNKNLFYKIFAKIFHTPLNFLNNLFADYNVDEKLKLSKFVLKNFENQYKKTEILSSPTRKLSDLFWQNVNWDVFKNENGEINVFDIGCGSGNYFKKLQDFSGNIISNYKGIDIYENQNWKILEKDFSNVEFAIYDGINILNEIPEKTNLIISQSAIEHIIEDITIFRQIKTFIEKSNHKVAQIHLFPSEICLRLYPFHGVRQYTPRNISKISKLFSDFCNVELFALGGKNSNNIHQKYINKGLFNKDIRNLDKEKYNNECYEAIKKDFSDERIYKPGFYALTTNVK